MKIKIHYSKQKKNTALYQNMHINDCNLVASESHQCELETAMTANTNSTFTGSPRLTKIMDQAR